MPSYQKPSNLAIVSSLMMSAGLPVLHAQEPAATNKTSNKIGAVEANPADGPEADADQLSELKKINATTYQLGEFTIDKKQRTISFEAETEITKEIIEYAIVTPAGKIHESLFITNARPIHFNIAFKLLGYKENKSLYKVFVNNFPTNKNQPATDEEKTKSFFTTTISWTDKETKKTHHHNINELIMNVQTEKTMASNKAKWSYGGSFIHQGKFVAEMNNDLIAIFTDRGAVANYAGDGREDDTLWFPITEKMPVKGTKVTITITPDFPADKKK
ncbi:MAG: YdjY domain-containing protein [Rubritalea sp.]|tara:strand:+ start:1986 stop:2807 length:822 start_codon:yes stop_codon:yes gene_type:complete